MYHIRLLTKNNEGKVMHQNWKVASWSYTESNNHEKGKGFVSLTGVQGRTEDHGSITIDPKDPPHDKDGLHSQRVFVMNEHGETIDSILVNPRGGWDCYKYESA